MTESETLNIGNKLRHRRQELNLSLDEVARQTKIRKTYILAIEEERFEELPGKVYIVGFLQNYARTLGIPAKPLVEALNQMPEPAPNSAYPRPELRDSTLTARGRSSFKRILLVLLVLMLAAVVLFYSPQILEMFRPPAGTGNPPAHQESPAVSAEEPLVPSAPAVVPDAPHSYEESEAQAETVKSLPVIPEGGGTLKIISQGEGEFRIAIDGDPARKYAAQPGLTLSWEVRQKADLDLDVDGPVRLVIGNQEYTAPGRAQVLLSTPSVQEE